MSDRAENGIQVLHMCEWYERGRRYVAEYETLGDGSGFGVTEDWSTGTGITENHMLTRPNGTPLPGIERFQRFDLKVDPDNGCRMGDYDAWETELDEQRDHNRFDDELRELGTLNDGESVFGRI